MGVILESLWNFTSYLSLDTSCVQYLQNIQNIPRSQHQLAVILVQNLPWNLITAPYLFSLLLALTFNGLFLMQQPQWSFFVCFGLCHLNLFILYDNFPPSFFIPSHATHLLGIPSHLPYKMPHILDVADCLLQVPDTHSSDPCISLNWWSQVPIFRQEPFSSGARHFPSHCVRRPIVAGCQCSAPDCSVASAWSLLYFPHRLFTWWLLPRSTFSLGVTSSDFLILVLLL